MPDSLEGDTIDLHVTKRIFIITTIIHLIFSPMKKSLSLVGASLTALVLLGAGCSVGNVQPTTPAAVAPAAPETFAVGAKIYSAWKGGHHWYPGTISAVGSGTYSIKYDDGDKESDVPASRIMKQDAEHPLSVKVGDKVLAKWSDGQWYDATVSAVEGGKVSVTYYDGFKQDTNLVGVFAAK